MADCAIPGCIKPARHRGWCPAHYERWRTKGDPLAGGPVKHHKPPGATCSVDGCSKPIEALGLCPMHYTRMRRYGDPTAEGVLPRHDRLTYSAVHMRLRDAYGPAAEHPCVDCGERALQWSFESARAAEVFIDEHRGLAYSTNVDDYVPRCGPCHCLFDELRAKGWATRRARAASE